ncbi:MAG: hypothetical protein IKQ60_09960 [Candidatus Methanomethylophilaceae archaeon]|nr:hypothetical protein [Candidatus Methanomethylophilaceae archaeon]
MSDGEYSEEDATNTIEAVIELKKRELEDLAKKKDKARKAEKAEEIEGLMAYINADLASYKALLSDMKDDESLLDGIDLTDFDTVDRPECYEDYMKSQGEEDAELDAKASRLRADYCDDVMETISQEIGEEALRSKKMVKAMLEDPYILSVIGETIFYDDKLYEQFSDLLDEDVDSKKGKKKSKKKSKKKGKD